MELPESLLTALEKTEGHSGIVLFCKEEEREAVRDNFLETFKGEYDRLLDLIENEFGDCSEKEDDYNPIERVELNSDGVCILIGNLDLHYRDYSNRPIMGTNIITGDDALAAVIEKLKKDYPSIRYEGYIGYFVSDSSFGEPYQYELSSVGTIEQGKTYGFLGEAISVAVENDEFWEELSEQLSYGEVDDFKEVIDCFKAYSDYLKEDTFKRLLSIAEECDEDLVDELREYLR